MAQCSGWNPSCEVVNFIVGVAETTKNTINFATDPFGFISHEMSTLAQGLSRQVIPALLDILAPDYTADWFLRSYSMSLTLAVLVMAGLMLWTGLERRSKSGKVSTAALMDSWFKMVPVFLIGALSGPLIGSKISELLHGLTEALAQWGVESSTKEFYQGLADRFKTENLVNIIGGSLMALFILFMFSLCLMAVVFILMIQLATQYLIGALIPLGWVWIVNPRTRKFGWAGPLVWVAILVSHALLFLMLGIAYQAIAGLTLATPEGGSIEQLTGLVVPTVLIAMTVFGPLSLVTMATRIASPTGGGGLSGNSGFSAPQGSGPRPSSPQRLADTQAQPPAASPSAPTAPVAPASTTAAPATAGTAAAGTGAASAAGTAAATNAGTVGAAAGSAGAVSAGASGATAAGAAASSTGVGAAVGVPIMVGAAALRLAAQGVKVAQEASEQAVEAGQD